MKVTVSFDIDLASVEAELEAQGLDKGQETINEVINEIKTVAIGTAEDLDAIYDAIDSIVHRRL